MRVDAHQHYWKLSRGDYGWLTPDMEVLYRDYLPADLSPALERHHIDKTILVQAAPTVAETDFMLTLAANTTQLAALSAGSIWRTPISRANLRSTAKIPHS